MSAYQCIKLRQTINTVYNQYLRFFCNTNRQICPQDVFCLDPIEFLQSALNDNTELIVCIGMNEKTRVEKL